GRNCPAAARPPSRSRRYRTGNGCCSRRGRKAGAFVCPRSSRCTAASGLGCSLVRKDAVGGARRVVVGNGQDRVGLNDGIGQPIGPRQEGPAAGVAIELGRQAIEIIPGRDGNRIVRHQPPVRTDATLLLSLVSELAAPKELQSSKEDPDMDERLLAIASGSTPEAKFAGTPS